MPMFQRRDGSENPSPGGDVEEMKPTFRQLRSFNEAVAAEELVVFEVEDDDKQTVETEQIPGAFVLDPPQQRKMKNRQEILLDRMIRTFHNLRLAILVTTDGQWYRRSQEQRTKEPSMSYAHSSCIPHS
jgi:hypothetical protein